MKNDKLVETKTFEERMIDKVKENVGELMTNEELGKIVEKSMHKIFFEETIIKNNYGTITHTEDPFIFPVIKELLNKQVEDHVKKYFKDNNDKILLLVDEVVKDGLGKAILGSIDALFSNAMFNLRNDIQNKLQNL